MSYFQNFNPYHQIEYERRTCSGTVLKQNFFMFLFPENLAVALEYYSGTSGGVRGVKVIILATYFW